MKTFDYVLCNGDTDSISIKRPDGRAISPEDREEFLRELNSQMPDMIVWEDDNYFKKFIVVRAKNYVLVDEAGTVKIKGSALKASTKEVALKRFISEVIELIIKDRMDQIYSLYNRYANEIVNLNDITEWCSKKTVTKAVLTGSRTNETRVLDAIGDKPVQEGDKVYMFFRTPTELCLRENFDGTYDRDILLGKLYDTLSVFDTIIQMDLFPNFALKRNAEMLTVVSGQNVKALSRPLKLVQTPLLLTR